MKPLRLPTLQNWSCHSCGDCCRDLDVRATQVERDRILALSWDRSADVPATTAAIVASPGSFVRMGTDYRLARGSDGACTFLNDRSLCEIHARFGERAKPLACRLYPFEFVPAGDGSLAVGVHYGCPSAAANRGPPLATQQSDLRPLARDLAERDPSLTVDVDPPPISGLQRLDWSETRRVLDAIDDLLTDTGSAPFVLRLLRARFVVRMLGQATFEKVRGARMGDLLDVLGTAAPDEVPPALDVVPAPDRVGWLEFRSLVAHLARKDTLARSSSGLGYRLRMVLAGARFAWGRGRSPRMNATLPPVPFAGLARERGSLSEEVDGVLDRYARSKVQSIGFAGTAFYGMSVAEGFSYLSLAIAATLYLGRWIGLANGRLAPDVDDVTRALSLVDAHVGRSPVLAMGHFRRRVRSLESRDQMDGLLATLAR